MSANAWVSFFRVSGAIFSVGTTLLSLIIPFECQQSYPKGFSLLHSFGAGALIGSGFITTIFESSTYSSLDSRTTWLIASFSFIFILSIENLLHSRQQIYEKLTTDDDSSHGGNFELTNNRKNQRTVTDEHEEEGDLEALKSKEKNNLEYEEENEVTDDIHNVDEEVAVKFKKVWPFSLIFFVLSSYGFAHGVALGSILHSDNDYGLLLRYLFQKAVVSLSVGTILAEIDFMHPILMFNVGGYIISDAIGILLGGFVFNQDSPKTNEAIVELLKVNSLLASIFAAVSSGLYLYLGIVYMLPVNLNVTRIIINTTDRRLHVLVLIFGYVVSVAISSLVF